MVENMRKRVREKKRWLEKAQGRAPVEKNKHYGCDAIKGRQQNN